jgi:hypothetical protein
MGDADGEDRTMNVIEFVSAWMLRYPQKKDEPTEAREQYRADVTEAAAAVGDALIEKFEQRLRGWKSQGRPSIPFMWQCAQDVKPAAGAVRDRGRYAYRCHGCGTVMSRNVGCPSCRAITTTDVVMLRDNSPPAKPVRNDCYRCGEYEGRGAFGPTCNSWGKTPGREDICRDCRCRPCCGDEKNWREHPRAMRDETSAVPAWLSGARSTRAPSRPPSKAS